MPGKRVVAALAVLVAAVAALTATTYATGTSSATPSATQLERQFVNVVNRVTPSVVQISTGSGMGSGVVFDNRGNIVTNAHVVAGAESVDVTLANGRSLRGNVVGSFTSGDLAVVRVSGNGLRPAVFADSSKLDVGDIVMAVGNPLGFQSSVTEGIVSGLGRTVGAGGSSIQNAIQTSASINPGNSGGALVDLDGRVIGIPTLGGQGEGIGFAVPSNTVRDIAGQLIRSGRVTNSGRAYLGVRIGEPFGRDGVLVGEVTPGTPAARAGMRQGDVIVSIAGQPTPSTTRLSEAMAALKPGQKVKVVVERGSGRTTLDITLGEFPG
jgi:putative serine protease PepD